MDLIKTLQLILDNPANTLNETSRSLIETILTDLSLDPQPPIRVETDNSISVIQELNTPQRLSPIKQIASIYQDDWLIVSHDSHEMVMSIDHWKKLVVLTNGILPTGKGGY